MEEKKNNGISLSDIFRVIKKNIILICIITFVITLIGGVYAFTRTPVYSANSTFVIATYNSQSEENAKGYSATDTLRLTNTVANLTKSTVVLNDVIYDYNNIEMDFKYDGKLYENTKPCDIFKNKFDDKTSSRNYIRSRITTNASNTSLIISITFHL